MCKIKIKKMCQNLTPRRNHLHPHLIRTEDLGIVTALCCKADGYIKNGEATEIICELGYFQTDFNESYRAGEIHGFFDGNIIREPCALCGAQLSEITPVFNCATCNSKYLAILTYLTRRGIRPSDVISLTYDHGTDEIVDLTINSLE